MTDIRDNPPERGNWFWVLVIVLLFGILIYWFYDPVGEVAEAPAPEQTAPNTEFTTAPEGGVPVELPDTQMTAVPLENESPPPLAE